MQCLSHPGGIKNPLSAERLVEEHLDRLGLLLDSLNHPLGDDPQLAYDALALWQGLRRFEPSLVARLGAEELRSLEEHIAAEGSALASALDVPDPEGWLEAARSLQSAYDNGEDAFTLAERTRLLLIDLDDAELMLIGVGRLGIHDEEVEEGLEECQRFLYFNRDLFLPTATYARGLHLALASDLATRDPELFQTRIKLLWIEKAVQEAMDRLSFAHQTPPSHGLAAALVRQRLPDPGRS